MQVWLSSLYLNTTIAHECTLLFLNMSFLYHSPWLHIIVPCFYLLFFLVPEHVSSLSVSELGAGTLSEYPFEKRQTLLQQKQESVSRQICHNKSVTVEKDASFQYLFPPPVCLHKNKKTTLGVNHLEHNHFFTHPHFAFYFLHMVLLPCLLENPFATNYAAKGSRVTKPRKDLGCGFF